jgi:hypothetical protein
MVPPVEEGEDSSDAKRKPSSQTFFFDPCCLFGTETAFCRASQAAIARHGVLRANEVELSHLQ